MKRFMQKSSWNSRVAAHLPTYHSEFRVSVYACVYLSYGYSYVCFVYRNQMRVGFVVNRQTFAQLRHTLSGAAAN